MAEPSGRFLRDNAFLVAAVLLPVVVVGFFLLSTAIPRWTVPPPAYDLLLRSQKPYDGSRPRIAIEFEVRDGRVQVSARTSAPDAYVPPQVLLLFDHKTMSVSEVPFTAPEPGRTDIPYWITSEAEGRKAEEESAQRRRRMTEEQAKVACEALEALRRSARRCAEAVWEAMLLEAALHPPAPPAEE